MTKLILGSIALVCVVLWKTWENKIEEQTKKTDSKVDDIIVTIIKYIIPLLENVTPKENLKEATKEIITKEMNKLNLKSDNVDKLVDQEIARVNSL